MLETAGLTLPPSPPPQGGHPRYPFGPTGVRIPGRVWGNGAPVKTMGLAHPADETAERLKDGQYENAMLSNRTRAELKYVIREIAGTGLEAGDAWNPDDLQEEVFAGEGSADMTKGELIALTEWVARAVNGEE